jgi:RNA polymerase sigma-70 factor (ECF subfamily)
LVRRAQAQDQEAFEELMRRTSSVSMRLALSIVKNRQEAEDQVQTSFFNAWRRLSSFNLEAKFSTWMRSIVVNQSLMHLRTKRRAPIDSLDERGEQEHPWEPADTALDHATALSHRELSERMRAEIRRMPPLFREVLDLRDLQELPIEDVATRLGVTASAAKSRLSRARQMLRERMARYLTGYSAIGV